MRDALTKVFFVVLVQVILVAGIVCATNTTGAADACEAAAAWRGPFVSYLASPVARPAFEDSYPQLSLAASAVSTDKARGLEANRELKVLLDSTTLAAERWHTRWVQHLAATEGVSSADAALRLGTYSEAETARIELNGLIRSTNRVLVSSCGGESVPQLPQPPGPNLASGLAPGANSPWAHLAAGPVLVAERLP